MEIYRLPAIVIFFLIILIRPLTVFFHEMGHAIIGWIITRKKINVFIGSYGNKDGSLNLKVSKLSFYIFKNPFKWGIGLCQTEEERISINNQLLFVFGGPVASLIVAILSYIIFIKTNLWSLFFLLLFISSLIDFLTNIFPRNKPIYLDSGRLTANDGQNIITLLKLKRLPNEFQEGIENFRDKKYKESAIIFENLLNKIKDENVYRMAMISQIQNKNYEKGKRIGKEFKDNFSMNSDDLTNFAISFTETNEYDEALKLYDESLKLNPKNKFGLNNKGYTKILLKDYQDSIILFDKAISIDKDFSFSYNNRGLAKIELGKLDEGLLDIKKSLELDSENADAHKNLGIYYLKVSEYEKALDSFLKSKKMYENCHLIDELIFETKKQIA